MQRPCDDKILSIRVADVEAGVTFSKFASFSRGWHPFGLSIVSQGLLVVGSGGVRIYDTRTARDVKSKPSSPRR